MGNCDVFVCSLAPAAADVIARALQGAFSVLCQLLITPDQCSGGLLCSLMLCI